MDDGHRTRTSATGPCLTSRALPMAPNSATAGGVDRLLHPTRPPRNTTWTSTISAVMEDENDVEI